MRSLECWTSEPKRASLVRRWTSSVSAALSSASETSVASAARLLCSVAGSAARRRSRAARASRRAPRAPARARTPTRREPQLHERSSRTSGLRRPAREQRAAVAGVTGHAAASSASATTTRVALGQAEPGGHVVAGERARRVERGAADVLATGGGDEVGARGAEDPLARDGALLLAHEAGHAGDDEAEEEDRGDVDHDTVVAVVDDLQQRHHRRDQGGAGEQHQPQRRQPRVAVRARPARARPSTGAAPPRPTAGRS